MLAIHLNYHRIGSLGVLLPVLVLLLGRSVLPPGDKTERVRAFTRQIEFDYLSWTLDALGVKVAQAALGSHSYLPEESARQTVLDYLDLVARIQRSESQLNDIYADPNIPDPESASLELRRELDQLYTQKSYLAPLAEAIFQTQLSAVLDELGIALGGQPIPPVLYHGTPLPMALIVSPREVIRQDSNISISPDLTLAEQVALEERVDKTLNVSSLVVPVGGIGTYPTMVYQSSDLNWLAEVVAHEWVHNFFSLRPLGISYLVSPELRTMNETAANIAGKEIGRALIARYYPERLPPPPPPPAEEGEAAPPQPPAFDFNAEMRLTRLTVDEMLAEGKIEEAEAYMEQRRRFLWEHGYRIRKLNQAYFAFYGAYADVPGGAAGEDPVGAAVRALRAQSRSLAEFLNTISWMASFEALEARVQGK